MTEQNSINLLQTEIEVESRGNKYVFAIPTVHDEIKHGAQMRFLLQTISGSSTLFGLDNTTFFYLEVCAAFETFLRRSSANWVFNKTAQGTPVVDSSKFPPDKIDELSDAYGKFREALTSFRGAGATDVAPAGAEALAGK
jgi:hypothetical protein